ncbi:MAG: hypothetical protein AAFX94_18090 [Myxococcota bacterium]
MRSVIESLDRAAEDKRVVGVLLHCADASLGLAQAQELRDALKRLADAGKEIVAYAHVAR